MSDLYTIKNNEKDGKDLYKKYLRNYKKINEYKRAIRYFVLNRITYSGTVYSGGYSQLSFEKRFTYSSIERLRPVSRIISDVFIKNDDYSNFLYKSSRKVFLYLDPPYYKYKESKLYGRKGDLHINFKHEKFAEDMKNYKYHNWLITYDNSDKIKELFSFANIYEFNVQYYMDNYNGKKPKTGEELFITNYRVPKIILNKLSIKNKKLEYRLIPVNKKR